jgi:hypothetical protein
MLRLEDFDPTAPQTPITLTGTSRFCIEGVEYPANHKKVTELLNKNKERERVEKIHSELKQDEHFSSLEYTPFGRGDRGASRHRASIAPAPVPRSRGGPPAPFGSIDARRARRGPRRTLGWRGLASRGEGHGFFNFGRREPRYAYETLTATDRFLASLGWLAGEPSVEAHFAATPPVPRASSQP